MTVQFTVAFKAVATVPIFKTYKNDCTAHLQIGHFGSGDDSEWGTVGIGYECGQPRRRK